MPMLVYCQQRERKSYTGSGEKRYLMACELFLNPFGREIKPMKISQAPLQEIL